MNVNTIFKLKNIVNVKNHDKILKQGGGGLPLFCYFVFGLQCPFANDLSHGGAGTGHVDAFIPNMRPQLIPLQVFQEPLSWKKGGEASRPPFIEK